jgi:hydrogenase maturation protein HypF
VRNDAAGVTIEAFGPESALDDFVRRLETSMPPAADIREFHAQAIPTESVDAFSIVESDRAVERRISIPPDLATCSDCLREVFDPADRRYRYPFTNCTKCGPRFTIARDTPYDRAATTMAAFEMCPACRREYECIDDRRFHAQPNACPRCGPALVCNDARGRFSESKDPVGAVAAALRLGNVVAIKGWDFISRATPRMPKPWSGCAVETPGREAVCCHGARLAEANDHAMLTDGSCTHERRAPDCAGAQTSVLGAGARMCAQ